MSSEKSEGIVIEDPKGFAFALVRPDETKQELYIETLSVSTGYHGQGHGSRMLDIVKSRYEGWVISLIPGPDALEKVDHSRPACPDEDLLDPENYAFLDDETAERVRLQYLEHQSWSPELRLIGFYSKNGFRLEGDMCVFRP